MKLGNLSERLGLSLRGNPDQHIERLAPIESAASSDLSFVVNQRYIAALEKTCAGAVIVTEALAGKAPGNCLVSADPYASYARASWLLTPDSQAEPGVHATAQVHASASVAASAAIGPYAVVEADCCIGEDVVIGAHCFLGQCVQLGAGSRLFPRVTVYPGCTLGAACRVQSGAVIGAEGFGYAPATDGWLSIHQTGKVRIGDRVHIGANTTIDRGALDDTVIADGVILDNQIQIAHNVQIGENTAIAGCVGIAGSTHIGRNCQIGGACNIVGHLTIADNVVLNAASLVTQSIDKPGRYSSGMPLQRSSVWRRTYVTLGKLDELVKRVRRLERKL